MKLSSLRTALPAAALSLLTLAAALPAEDTVVVRRVTGGEIRLSGAIDDLNGRWLVFRSGGGREDRIPRERVVAWQTSRTSAHQDARQAMSQRQWAEALRGLRTAAAEDTRVWMRRRIHADISLCAWNLGDIGLAGEHFAIVCQSDPRHRFYSRTPLPWGASGSSRQPLPEAETWLQDKLPIKQLMGASWLLNRRREQATGVLRGLLTHEDPRLVALAEAQLWRPQLVVAPLDEVQRWQSRLRQFPDDVRHGPLQVVGRALLRLQAYEDAAVALMRAPVEHPEMQTLASQGLLESGAAMQRLGRAEDARRIYQELLAKYAGTESASLAKDRMEVEQN